MQQQTRSTQEALLASLVARIESQEATTSLLFQRLNSQNKMMKAYARDLDERISKLQAWLCDR